MATKILRQLGTLGAASSLPHTFPPPSPLSLSSSLHLHNVGQSSPAHHCSCCATNVPERPHPPTQTALLRRNHSTHLNLAPVSLSEDSRKITPSIAETCRGLRLRPRPLRSLGRQARSDVRCLHSSPLWPNTHPVSHLHEGSSFSAPPLSRGPVDTVEQLLEVLEEKRAFIRGEGW